MLSVIKFIPNVFPQVSVAVLRQKLKQKSVVQHDYALQLPRGLSSPLEWNKVVPVSATEYYLSAHKIKEKSFG